MGKRRCTRCGGLFDEEVFFRRKSGPAIAGPDRHSACIGCEQTARDEKKYANRAMVKARNALRTHAAKYIAAGVVSSQAEFAERFDWDIKQMAHDINHTAGNGCQRCRKSFASMGNGLSDVSLDIHFPDHLPFYRTNVRWICKTCNSSKGRASPEEDGRRLAEWMRWQRQQEEIRNADPWKDSLFEGTGWAS